jgi:epoxyqueuosine reductase
MNQAFDQAMRDAGFRYAAVPIARLHELRREMAAMLDSGAINPDFAEYVRHVFTLMTGDKFEQAQTLIVASMFSPAHQIVFSRDGQPIPVLAPPGFIRFRERQAEMMRIITAAAAPYKLERVIIPVKLMAVRSGLAEYGRNNIVHVGDWGSHHSLGAFITDAPCGDHTWREMNFAEACRECAACVDACPSGAIDSGSRVIHGERCITLFNENPGELPDWIEPEWNHAIIGCYACQACCPMNREHTREIPVLETFDDTETEEILRFDGETELSPSTAKKLARFGMPERQHLLGRNLRAIPELS